MGTGTGGPKGGSGVAQQQNVPAPGTAGYGNSLTGTAAPGGKGQGKGAGGVAQQQNPQAQQPQGLPQANSDLQRQQLQDLYKQAMGGAGGDPYGGMKPPMGGGWGSGGIGGLMSRMARPPSPAAPVNSAPGPTGANFLGGDGSDPGAITPAAAATGASPGGPLSGRMDQQMALDRGMGGGGFGGYGRFRGWGMNRGGFGNMMGGGFSGGATPAGFANGGIVTLAGGGPVYGPVDPLEDISQYPSAGLPEWLDKYIPSVAGYATTGDFFATDPEIQRGIAKKERAKKHANGGIVTLAEGGPVSWSPVAATARPAAAKLAAITAPAAYVARPQQAIWQPPAAAAPAAAAANVVARNRLNAMRAANAQFGRNGAAGGFMGGGAGGSGAMGGGGWGGFGGGSAGSNWGGRGAY